MFSNRVTRHPYARPLLVVALVILLLASFPVTPAAAAPNCQFVYGFKTLHTLIPNVVGNCVSNEAYAANGDALQKTTDGLLVWRKADNHTAFTNGFDTWVLGPDGLQVRQNNARFAWEPDAAPPDVDPRLSASYQLAANSSFSSVVTAAVRAGVPIRVANLSGGWGVFTVNGGNPLIYIDSALLTTDPADAAAVIVHEATHLQQYQTQPNFRNATSSECLGFEFQATVNDLTFWRDEFGSNGKQPPANSFEAQINYQLSLAESSLRALLAQTAIDYQQECG